MLNIDPYTILWTIIDLLILFVLMKKFLFQPVNNILESRAKAIRDSEEQARRDRESAQQLRDTYEQKLSQAREEADQLLAQARTRGDALYQETVSDAKAQARRILSENTERCRRDRETMLEGLRREMAALVTQAAARVAAGEDGGVDAFLSGEEKS